MLNLAGKVFGHHNLKVAKAVAQHAGDIAEGVAHRHQRKLKGRYAIVKLKLNALGVKVIGADVESAASTQTRGTQAVVNDAKDLTKVVGGIDNPEVLGRHQHAL